LNRGSGAYRGEIPAESRNDVSPEEPSRLMLAALCSHRKCRRHRAPDLSVGTSAARSGNRAIVGNSPLMRSPIVLMMLAFLAIGAAIARTITSTPDGINAVTKTFAGLSGLIFLLFVISQFLAYFT
jgi:aminobenzoyl-glutamate transport protein